VVHCDLKPANILLAAAPAASPANARVARYEDVYGWPVVSGFECARGLHQPADLEGTIVGTPLYMAPEQARGAVAEIGPATDVYGLGGLLYEMLTGRPPFPADSFIEVFKQVLEQEPAAVRSLNRDVDRRLAEVCERCLRKDPARRFARAADLADALDEFTRAPGRGWFG
jgi:serine/threonine-protein kinase